MRSVFHLLLFNLFIINLVFGQTTEKVDSLEGVYQNVALSDSLRMRAIISLIERHLYNDRAKAKAYNKTLSAFSENANYQRGIAFYHSYLGTFYSLSDQLDSAEYQYQIAVTNFKAIKDKVYQSQNTVNIGVVHYQKGHYQKALKILNKDLDFCEKELGEEYKGLGMTHGLIGLIHHFLGHQHVALKHFLRALKIHEENGNEIRQADMLHYLALVEMDLSNFEQAIDYNKKAQTIFQAHNDIYFEGQVINNLGLVYFETKNIEQAEKHFLRSLEIAKKMDNRAVESSGYLNLSKIATHKKQYEQAQNLLFKSLEIVEKAGNLRLIVEASNALGKNYAAMNRLSNAKNYFSRSIFLADSIKAEEHLKEAYIQRSKVYEKMGKTDLAFKDFKQYEIIKDTLLNKTKIQQIEELRILHDIAQKEQSLALQKNQISLLEKEATLSRLQKWLLGLGLGFSCIILVLGYFGFKQKIMRNRLQKEQQKVLYEKELAFKKRELTTHALHLAKKNELLGDLKQKAMNFKATVSPQIGYQKLINTIDFDLQDDNNWENFRKYFEQIHTDFNTTVLSKFPKVTSNDLRLMALLKMNLSSKEIANILNISAEGVKKARQRLRKKLELTPNDSLEGMIMEF